MTSLAERLGRTDALVGPAELRALRVASVVLGVAVLGFLAANLAVAWQNPALLTHWWWVTALSGRLLFGLCLLIAPLFAGAAALRALALGFAVFGLLTVAASLLAVAGGMTEVLRDQALYAWAAVLALRPVQAWSLILAGELLSVMSRMLRAADPIPLLESSLVSLTTTLLLMILLHAVLQAARTRDAGERSALQAIRQDLAEATSTIERERIERVVHDDVLATLRAVILGLSTARADPALMAARALQRIAALEQPPAAGEEAVDGVVLVNRLRALVAVITPGAEVRVVIAGRPEIPAEVSRAIAEACGEALRNSVLHAPPGREARRSVRGRIAPDAVDVSVDDDGEGFDLGKVPPHRLGIARSIVERMRAVPGGNARVRSAPGAGTTVTVSWHA